MMKAVGGCRVSAVVSHSTVRSKVILVLPSWDRWNWKKQPIVVGLITTGAAAMLEGSSLMQMGGAERAPGVYRPTNTGRGQVASPGGVAANADVGEITQSKLSLVPLKV